MKLVKSINVFLIIILIVIGITIGCSRVDISDISNDEPDDGIGIWNIGIFDISHFDQ